MYKRLDFEKLTEYVSQKIPGNILFKIPLMKHSDLIAAVDSLDIKKSIGIDGISAKILKASAKIVSSSLLKNKNISLYSGHFSDALKIEKR